MAPAFFDGYCPARFALADEQQRPRARAFAEQAVAELRRAGPSSERALSGAAQWLAEHPWFP
jgi:hypothetical protein